MAAPSAGPNIDGSIVIDALVRGDACPDGSAAEAETLVDDGFTCPVGAVVRDNNKQWLSILVYPLFIIQKLLVTMFVG